VDVACFERIMTGTKTFDIVFAYKNYEKGWVRLESIDTDLLPMIKQVLDQRNVLFF
jgi:nucleosome binding factor SPN SPT16 subunit